MHIYTLTTNCHCHFLIQLSPFVRRLCNKSYQFSDTYISQTKGQEDKERNDYLEKKKDEDNFMNY